MRRIETNGKKKINFPCGNKKFGSVRLCGSRFHFERGERCRNISTKAFVCASGDHFVLTRTDAVCVQQLQSRGFCRSAFVDFAASFGPLLKLGDSQWRGFSLFGRIPVRFRQIFDTVGTGTVESVRFWDGRCCFGAANLLLGAMARKVCYQMDTLPN